MKRSLWSGILALPFAAILGICSAQAENTSVATGMRSDGKVRADVLSLKRTEGDTLTLRFSIMNNSSQTVTVTVSLMKLVDLVGRATYSPGVSSDTCHADAAGQTTCWAVFAAPAPETKNINVKFYDDFDLILAPISN
jgi:hypothetical protein